MTDDTGVATDEPTTSESNIGWITAQQQTQPCNEIGQRHSYKGGDVCLKCGTPKPVHQPRTLRTEAEPSERQPRGTSSTVKQFQGLLSMSWMAMGVGIAAQDRVKPEIAGPVGRVLQFQAPTAGPRIKNALSKTPAWKPILAMMKLVGPWTDLAPLIAPPILVGIMAWKPQAERAIMPFLLPLMMPVIQEVSDMAAEQEAMMQNISDMQNRMGETMAAVRYFLTGDENAASSPNGAIE